MDYTTGLYLILIKQPTIKQLTGFPFSPTGPGDPTGPGRPCDAKKLKDSNIKCYYVVTSSRHYTFNKNRYN